MSSLYNHLSQNPKPPSLSPMKKGDKRRGKKDRVVITGSNIRISMLQQQIQSLRQSEAPPDTPDHEHTTTGAPETLRDPGHDHPIDVDPPDLGHPLAPYTSDPQANPFESQPNKKKKSEATDTANSKRLLYLRWRALLPALAEPLLLYMTRTQGTVLTPPSPEISVPCKCPGICQISESNIKCLFYDHFCQIKVHTCQCHDLFYVLLYHGLFPFSPCEPRTAVSVPFLDFYAALFQKGFVAINAVSHALNMFYRERGFVTRNKKNDASKDPFRKGFSQANQWYTQLQILLENRTRKALDRAQGLIPVLQQEHCTVADLQAAEDHSQPAEAVRTKEDDSESEAQDTGAGVTSGRPTVEPHSSLQHMCPACFSMEPQGITSAKGADIQVCVDGNFNLRHYRSKKASPPFHTPTRTLTKEYVDNIGQHLARVRQKEQKPRSAPKAPDVAVDASNIDTPGEQQKYPVALINRLFELLPATTTVHVYYDVGCVLDRSRELYDYFDREVNDRLSFATSAMHVYAHHWACQVSYNPRMNDGNGLTNGEGNERLWSEMHPLVTITRVESSEKRMCTIDTHAADVGKRHRASLGDWMKRRLNTLIANHERSAKDILSKCSQPTVTLRQQWSEQKASQMSLRSHAPARLKKALESVLGLQSEIDSMEKAIEATSEVIKRDKKNKAAKAQLKRLQATYQTMLEDVQELYVTLNVVGEFPELEGVPYEFVQKLLLLFDLKINIRKRAIGSFFETDRIDQAVGGKDRALGTKMHQKCRASIKKRSPALVAALNRYNKICQEMAEVYEPSWNVPLPDPLPTKIKDLRECEHLMHDVWISRTPQAMAGWLIDQDVRDGIRAVHLLDRCAEERTRIARKADNMHRWYGREMSSVEIALALPENSDIRILLSRHRDHLLMLKSSWVSVLVTSLRYDHAVACAKALGAKTSHLFAAKVPDMMSAVHPEVMELTDNESDEEDVDDDATAVGDEETPRQVSDSKETPDVEKPLVHSEDAALAYIYYDDEAPEEIATDEAPDVPDDFVSLWVCPNPSYRDTLILQDISGCPSHFAIDCTRRSFTVAYPAKEIHWYFDEIAIQKFSSPTAWLNDDCINSGAALLHQLAANSSASASTSNRCTVFSSYVMLSVRCHRPLTVLWRQTSYLQYWEKSMWVIPIHRRGSQHWAMAFAHVPSRRIYVFDSFADQGGYHTDAKDIILLVTSLAILAGKHSGSNIALSGWTSQTVLMDAVQHDGHSCGVWILAAMAAVFRGRHVTGLASGEDIKRFRSYLLYQIMGLPRSPLGNR